MKFPISVVLPTYNRSKDLKRCLDSLMRQTHRDFELVVIDNGSTDDTLEILQQYPVKVIRDSTKNLFYLANLGWRAASFDIVAYISDDCEAESEWLKNIVDIFEGSLDAGAVGGPAISTQPQEIASVYLTAKSSALLDIAAKIYTSVVMEGRFHDVGVLFQSGAFSMGGSMLHSAKLKEPVQVDFLTLTNMAVRKNVLKELDGFDDSFPQHHGDLDLAIRMKDMGYRIIFDPKALVWHHPNPKGPSRNRFQLAYDYAHFYARDIKPLSSSGYLRLILNAVFFNLFWLYKAVETRSVLPLTGIAGFVSGLLHYIPRRTS